MDWFPSPTKATQWFFSPFFSSARVRTNQRESHDYSMTICPAPGQRPPHLILGSTSSAQFLLITGLLWVPWHAEHGCAKPHSTQRPPLLLPSHTQLTDYFSPISFLWWCSHHLHHNHARRECSPLLNPTPPPSSLGLNGTVKTPRDLWLCANFNCFPMVMKGAEGGTRWLPYSPHKTVMAAL